MNFEEFKEEVSLQSGVEISQELAVPMMLNRSVALVDIETGETFHVRQLPVAPGCTCCGEFARGIQSLAFGK